MNAIMNMESTLTMTSREIADLVGSRHDDTKRSIERLANQGVIVQPPVADEPGQDALGRPRTTQVYVFSGEKGKRDSIVVVAQLSPEFTARLVDRWQELERMVNQPKIPQTMPQALRLAAELAEQRDQLALENKTQAAALAEAQPKAAALDRIALETEGAVCLRIAAKLAQVPEKQFTSFLNQAGWIFRHHHSNTWQGYSDKEKAGLLELKRTRVTRDDGSEKTVEQVLVTPKGQAKAAELIERKAPWLRKAGTMSPPKRTDSPATGVH